MIHIAYIESDNSSLFTFEQIAVVLNARGIENQFHSYTTPTQALEHLPLQRPDITFIDLRSNNGHKPASLDLVRMLRQHPLLRGMIVIGMADYAMPADRSAALAAGCHEFLPKPARYQTIEETISQHLLQPAH
ncbi:MAG: response regulator [Chloroflexi bacterium]|nr:response regulator [Chloroflexota bacterium]